MTNHLAPTDQEQEELLKWIHKHLNLTAFQCACFMTVLAEPGLNVHRYEKRLENWIKDHESLIRPMIPTPKKAHTKPPEPVSSPRKPRRGYGYGSTYGWLTNRLVSLGLVVHEKVEARSGKQSGAIQVRRLVNLAPQFEVFLKSYRARRKLPDLPDGIAYGIVIENDPWRVFMVRNPDHPVESMRKLYQLPMKYWAKGDEIKPIYPHPGAAAEAAVKEMSDEEIELRAYDGLPDYEIKNIWANGKYTEHIPFAGLVRKISTRKKKKKSRFCGCFFNREQLKAVAEIDDLSREWLLGLSEHSLNRPQQR